MRYSTLFLILAVLLPTACTSAPQSLSVDDEAAIVKEVVETLNGLTEAMNAHDPEKVFSFYRQDESFFYLGCTSTLAGWDTFATRVGSYYTFSTDVTFEQTILSVQALSPTVAVAALAGSSTEANALFWTQVLQKSEDGRWLITHEHESWPGCAEPKGPHAGTEGMGEWEELEALEADTLMPGDSGIEG